MQTILIILGLLIVVLTFWDFFHTTFSGNGFGKVSLFINKSIAQIILKINSKTLFNYSGFIHVMTSLFTSFILLLFGVFIVFISADDMVVHAITKMPSSTMDRFYYICYLLSTAGFGNLLPGNNLSAFFSSIFSFAGFVLLTSAMTYLISVINSMLRKKELALYISSLGKNMDELYRYFTIDEHLTTLTGKSGHLRQMINISTSNLTTFPIIHYYLPRERKYALELQLASLYEVLIVLKKQTQSKSIQQLKINTILTSIDYYLIQERNKSLRFSVNQNKLNTLRGFWSKYEQSYSSNNSMDKKMTNALREAGWHWEDVYHK